MTHIFDAAPLVASADVEETLLRIRDEEEGPVGPTSAGRGRGRLSARRPLRPSGPARLLSDLAAWRYDVACLEAGDYRVVAELDARYSDLGVSFADCSIDEGHFRAVAPRQGGSFSLLPADF